MPGQTYTVPTMDFDRELVRLVPWMRMLAGNFCRDGMDIDDLVSDTVCKMLSCRHRFNSGRSMKPWCEKIMLNTYITQYNRSKLVTFVRADTEWCAVSDSSASDSVDVRDIAEAIERLRKRSRCIDCMLLYAKGYTYDEISEMLGIPVGTVRSRISAARSMMRNELEPKVK